MRGFSPSELVAHKFGWSVDDDAMGPYFGTVIKLFFCDQSGFYAISAGKIGSFRQIKKLPERGFFANRSRFFAGNAAIISNLR